MVLRQFKLHWLGCSFGFILACFVSLCPAFSEDQKISLQSIRIAPDFEGDRIEIQSDHPFAFITYTLQDPDRLVLDVIDPDTQSVVSPQGTVQGHLVRSWNVRSSSAQSGSALVDYIEFELAAPSEHLLESSAGKLILHLRPKAHDLLPPTAGESVVPPAGPAVSAVLLSPPPPPSGPKLWDLDQSLQFGMGRQRAVRVAREEIELAQMKVREARRALYPAATLKFSWTEGIASQVNFTEYTSGLQLEQPLYYSGRLMEAYRQSLVNLHVAEKRQGKVKADYSLEMAQEYYQFIAAKLSRAAQEGLLAECDKFQEQAKVRFEKKLLTRLEVLNMESQANQAKFQRTNAENDLALARLKYIQKLGLEPSAQVDVAGDFAPPSEKVIDLEEALKLAARYKPDILVDSLLVTFHEYEERIAKAKLKWKVDLSGFIGASAAAFETEPLDSGEDYFVGLKATHAWGPHSTTASVTKTKTSPRLGQTTRTDSTVYSAEMGILDQLQGLSEIQQAQVNLEKARRDLEDAKKATFQEIQEAYISYQKARLQLQYAGQKIAFRQEQVKILQAQANLNEVLPSQVLEAIVKLTEERVGQAQALGNYYVALAKLNKAVGLPGHYR